jgi:hypothetical protein
MLSYVILIIQYIRGKPRLQLLECLEIYVINTALAVSGRPGTIAIVLIGYSTPHRPRGLRRPSQSSSFGVVGRLSTEEPSGQGYPIRHYEIVSGFV